MSKHRDSIRVAVHNGSYHADDVFAMAIVNLWTLHKGYDIIMTRTRDQDILETCQIVMDVGGIFDPKTHRFDHHQSTFTEKRANGIPFAAAGLVWRHYGLDLCGNDNDVWAYVDMNLIQQIDAIDNGFVLTRPIEPLGVPDATISQLIAFMRPSWKELTTNENANSERFWEMVSFAKYALERLIITSTDTLYGIRQVNIAYEQAKDKRVIVLEKDYPWESLLSQYSEPLYVIYPRTDGDFGIKCVRINGLSDFSTRVSFPIEWRGHQGDKLKKITSNNSITFCHRDGFLTVISTLESALELVQTLIFDRDKK